MRAHLRANVVGYLALLVALGGTSAWAADKITSKEIARNAVKSKQIGGGQVREGDIQDGAVSGAKLADGAVGTGKLEGDSVTGSNVLDGTLTGADVDEPSLGGIGSGVMLATLRNLFAGVGSALYAPVGVSASDGDYHDALAPVPFVATDLQVRLDGELTDPGASRSFILRVDDSDTALQCTIATGQQSCSSNQAVAVPAGVTVAIRTSNTNTTYVEDAAVGWVARTP